jgi:hypothetical protein
LTYAYDLTGPIPRNTVIGDWGGAFVPVRLASSGSAGNSNQSTEFNR